MKTYPSENWKALGAWIAGARAQAGFSDTKDWAGAAQRSTRQLLGLERGEAVGPKTIESVAAALEINSGALFAILETGEALASLSELRLQNLETADRLALAQPPESRFWTSPQGDDADEPVTWSHMEGRLAEIEERLRRLERNVLRVVNTQAAKGGDGDDSERAAAPNTEAVSEVDDTLGAAAKEQEIQGSGEEGSI